MYMTYVVFEWMNNLCKCSPPLTGAIFISIWDYQIHAVTVGVYLKKKKKKKKTLSTNKESEGDTFSNDLMV